MASSPESSRGSLSSRFKSKASTTCSVKSGTDSGKPGGSPIGAKSLRRCAPRTATELRKLAGLFGGLPEKIRSTSCRQASPTESSTSAGCSSGKCCLTRRTALVAARLNSRESSDWSPDAPSRSPEYWVFNGCVRGCECKADSVRRFTRPPGRDAPTSPPNPRPRMCAPSQRLKLQPLQPNSCVAA